MKSRTHLVPPGEDTRVVRARELPALEREHADLIMSLRALCAVLREPPGDAVLARILDAELHQLDVLGGELLSAERIETGRAGETEEVDLARALNRAVKRSGRSTQLEMRGRVVVEGHLALIQQSIASVLALAHRIAEGPVRATAFRQGMQGIVLITVPTNEPSLANHNGRLAILHRIARAESGRLMIQHKDGVVHLRLAFWTP